jgi:hypothetical protein
VIELEKENDELRERIERMEAELNVLRTATSNLQQQQHRQSQGQVQSSPGQQLASPAPSGGGTNCDTCVVGKDCLCLSSALGETSAPSIAVPQSSINDSPKTPDTHCGLCLSTSCICQDLGIRDSQQTEPSPPTSPVNLKRKRSKPTSSGPLLPTPQSYPMEIDFTSSFTSSLSPTTRRDSLLGEGCGFCSDGTPCICLQNTLPPLQSDLSALTQEAHPEAIRRGGGKRPQVNDVKIFGGSIPRVGSPMTIASGNGGCTGEPGTKYHSYDTC